MLDYGIGRRMLARATLFWKGKESMDLTSAGIKGRILSLMMRLMLDGDGGWTGYVVDRIEDFGGGGTIVGRDGFLLADQQSFEKGSPLELRLRLRQGQDGWVVWGGSRRVSGGEEGGVVE